MHVEPLSPAWKGWVIKKRGKRKHIGPLLGNFLLPRYFPEIINAIPVVVAQDFHRLTISYRNEPVRSGSLHPVMPPPPPPLLPPRVCLTCVSATVSGASVLHAVLKAFATLLQHAHQPLRCDLSVDLRISPVVLLCVLQHEPCVDTGLERQLVSQPSGPVLGLTHRGLTGVRRGGR